MAESVSEVTGCGMAEGDAVAVRLDARQFAQSGAVLKGVADFPVFGRLAEECRSERGVEWSVAGSVDADGVCWLDLDVAAEVTVQCQRCLADMSLSVDSTSRFRLVFAGEIWGDEDIDDDSFEALEVDGPLDLAVLVEDEVLLSLPAVPLHERCDLPDGAGRGELPAKPSPFAVLGQLKRN